MGKMPGFFEKPGISKWHIQTLLLMDHPLD